MADSSRQPSPSLSNSTSASILPSRKPPSLSLSSHIGAKPTMMLKETLTYSALSPRPPATPSRTYHFPLVMRTANHLGIRRKPVGRLRLNPERRAPHLKRTATAHDHRLWHSSRPNGQSSTCLLVRDPSPYRWYTTRLRTLCRQMTSRPGDLKRRARQYA